MTSTNTFDKVKASNVNIGINEKNLNAVGGILTRALSDETVFYTRLRKYHWNVTGPMFHSLHETFEVQYTAIAIAIDEIAERIRSLGMPTPGTLTEFLQCSNLEEHPGKYPKAMEMVEQTVADHEAIIRYLRESIEACEEEYNDVGTADFLTAKLEEHEKFAWMLRAFTEERATD